MKKKSYYLNDTNKNNHLITTKINSIDVIVLIEINKSNFFVKIDECILFSIYRIIIHHVETMACQPCYSISLITLMYLTVFNKIECTYGYFIFYRRNSLQVR